MSRKLTRRRSSLRVESLEDRTTPTGSPLVRTGYSFAGPQFTDNGTNVFVPPDPGIAAGKNYTVTIANAQLQWRTMPAGGANQQSLYTFLGVPGGGVIVSPRVTYDPYMDRFLVAALVNNGNASTSSIFLAVSDNGDPNGTWYRKSVQVDGSVSGFTTFGQYLGLAVDEEAVYATTSQYTSGGAFKDARVVILEKTNANDGGWYGGGVPIAIGTFDPDGNAANDARYEGLVPASMYNSPTPPAGTVGTYFVAYNGSSAGGSNESVQVVRVDNPLTAHTFAALAKDVGDIDDTSLGLPAAPQPGSSGIKIDLGIRTIANAVWRDNRLYFGTTVRTGGGAAAAHWFQFNTGTNLVEQQGDVDTTPVASGLFSYHPSVAVDFVGDLAVSFSASNVSNEVLGYYAARTPNLGSDPSGTLRAPEELPGQASGNEYVRRVAGVNVWGLYSGITIAANDRVFWGFNAFATSKDTNATAPDQGRWGTEAGAFSFNWPPDVVTPIFSFSVNEDDLSISPLPLDSHFFDYEDLGGANLHYSVVGNDRPDIVTATVAPGGHQVDFTLIPNANGLAFITVRATDNGTTDAPAAYTDTSFILSVLAVNDLPTANPDSYSTTEDTPLSVPPLGVLDNDTDIDTGTTLAAVLFSGPSNAASFSLHADGSFDYTPAADFSGTDSFTYQAFDGTGKSPLPAATVTITVDPVNDAPNPQDDVYTINEDQVFNQPAPGVLLNDTDVDSPAASMSAIIDTPPAHAQSFTLHPNGSFDYVPEADYNGTDTFKYKASDGSATNPTPALVTINITPVDDAPRPMDDTYPASEGQLLTVTAANGVLFNDKEVDGQSLTITQNTVTVNGQLNFSKADGSFTYNPNAHFTGTDTFTYFVTDGTTEVGPVTVSIIVNPVDDPPVATADSYKLDEDTPLSVPAAGVLANDTDIDSPALSAEIVTPPTHALSFNLNSNGSFNYTPVANFFGTDSFTYHAKDASSSSNDVTVTLSVKPVQDAVVAFDDMAAASGKPVRINVLSNDVDPDPDTLTVSGYTKPAFGKVSRSGSALIYTPLPGASGIDTFSYTVSDGHGHTDTGTVTVNVADAIKPKVQNLRVGYGGKYADLLGYSKSTLPFSGINSVSVVFSENVTAMANALTVTFNSAVLGTTFAYNAANHTGTWTLTAPITTIGRLSIKLTAVGVTDGGANTLGSDLGKTIGVLPGDYDRNGVVNDADLKAIKKKLNKVDRFADVDGSGIVDQTDLTIATNNKGKKVP